jgi:hypothetical protein
MNPTNGHPQRQNNFERHPHVYKEIDGTLYIRIVEATGKGELHLPKELKDPRCDGVVAVDSLNAAFDDPWVNPCSGGVIGKETICEYLGITGRTFQRQSRSGGVLAYIPSVGGGSARVYAANQSSLDNSAAQLEEYRRRSSMKNLEKADQANPKKRR